MKPPIPFDPDAHANAAPVPVPAPAPVPAGDVIDRADGERGLSRPLDNDAKWRLVRVAKEAWEAVGPEADFDTWRQAEARKATGGLSISEACVRHYRLIQAHFLRLKGAVEAAKRAEERAAVGALEIARDALKRQLLDTKQDWQAARTIAGRFYKGTELRDLTAKQVWTVVYTLRNNANAKAGRGNAVNRFKGKRKKSGARASAQPEGLLPL